MSSLMGGRVEEWKEGREEGGKEGRGEEKEMEGGMKEGGGVIRNY